MKQDEDLGLAITKAINSLSACDLNKVLVIDDEKGITDVVEKALEKEGYSVCTAYDGSQGIELYHTRKPCLVITDINMPEKDGLDVLREIREDSKDIEVIMMSGYSEFDDVKEALQLGASDYLGKPLKLDRLLHSVNKSVEHMKLKRENEMYSKQLEHMVNVRTRQLKHALDVKNQFLANMGHEIKTPINGISGFAQILGETELTEEQQDYVDTISQCTEGLMKVVNEMLDYSRIDNGSEPLRESEFSINQMMEGLKERYSGKLEGKDVKIISSCDFEDKHIKADAEKLQAALEHLLQNAVKFTEEGEIEIGYRPAAGNMMQFYVRDTGTGIPEDKKELVLEPFQQADTSSTRKYGGKGLGLTTAKMRVEQMGGRLSFESVEGEGSNFRFYVPFKQIDGEKAGYDKAVKNEDRKYTILLADDNPVNRKLAEMKLRKGGYDTILADDGAQALSCYENNSSIDLILMDVHMPNMDGISATRSIRELEGESGKHIPIVMLTSSASDQDKNYSIEAGCDGYITKPIPANLGEMIIDYIK